MTVAVAVLSFLLLSSCINPYARHYQGVPDARIVRGYDLSAGNFQIYRTENFERDGRALIRKGFSPIGRATFNIGQNQISEWQLREQAEKVGAHIVLIASRYTHTIAGAIPLFIPRTTTAHSTGSATAYSRGVVANAYGSATTTIYSTQALMMPYSEAHFDVAALFFAKTQPRVGIYSGPLDDETRKRLQTNFGVRVVEVMEESPAFEADILPGDVVLGAHGEQIQSSEHFLKLLNKYEGESVAFKFERDGKIFEKQLLVRALPAPIGKTNNNDTKSLEQIIIQEPQVTLSSDFPKGASQATSSPAPAVPRPVKEAPPKLAISTATPTSLPRTSEITVERKPLTKTYASLVQYDGPKIKSGVTLEAEFVDDGSDAGEGRIIYPGNGYVLDGKWKTLAPGRVEAPKLIAKKALNALRLLADAPLVSSRFLDNETIVECLHGETEPYRQRKGQCQDNRGNKYHLIFRQ
jgi:hypothetical protein